MAFWYIVLRVMLLIYTRGKIRFSNCDGLFQMCCSCVLFCVMIIFLESYLFFFICVVAGCVHLYLFIGWSFSMEWSAVVCDRGISGPYPIFELLFYKHFNNIGITHVFSCINICRVPRMLFEHEADRPSVQTSSEGPGKC